MLWSSPDTNHNNTIIILLLLLIMDRCISFLPLLHVSVSIGLWMYILWMSKNCLNMVIYCDVSPCGRSVASRAFAALNAANTPNRLFHNCDNVLLFILKNSQNFEFSRMMEAFDLHQHTFECRIIFDVALVFFFLSFGKKEAAKDS